MKCACGKCEVEESLFSFIFLIQNFRGRIISFLASSGLILHETKPHFYIKIALKNML